MSVPNDGKTAVEHASTAKKVMKQLKSELRDCEPDDLDSEDVVKLRRRFVHECEKAMDDSTFLSNMYELLWANAFYATVHVYRSAWKLNNGLRLKEKEDLIEFVKKTEKYLRNLQKTYPELDYQIFLNIGDLYRYCADITKSEEHLKTAIKYYGRALIIKPDEGHPFNQVGVMYRVQNPWKAAIMFLRGATALNPYKAAEDNFLLLKQTGFSNDWKELTWDYVYGMFEPFNRIVLDNFKTSWLNKLRSEFENDKPDIEKAYDSFGFVLLGSVLAIIDDQRSGNGERTRYLVHSLCEDYKYLVKEVGDIKRRSPTETRMKHRIKELKMRRRKKKTEEDSSDEEYKLFDSDNDDDEKDEEGDAKQEKDMILPLLAMIIDWFT
uniref:DNA/RNA-binding domain-containing protein n=1 Tax=Panagrolaimus sp. JU765 TaxID=591449 RepID=A0AC34Q3R8_9BILA